MKYTCLARSSSGDPYDVTFESIDGRMTVRCSCKAGALQQQCKHKRALVSGDLTMLFASDQADVLKQVLARQESQPLIAAIASAESDLANVESEKNRLTALEKTIKNRIGKIFSGAALS